MNKYKEEEILSIEREREGARVEKVKGAVASRIA